MNHKEKCEKLRLIRLELAKELGVEEYIRKEPCTFEGECNGTCEACQLEEQNLLYAMYDLKEKGEIKIIKKVPFELKNDGSTLGLPIPRYERPIEAPKLPPISMPGVIVTRNIEEDEDEDENNKENENIRPMMGKVVRKDSLKDAKDNNVFDEYLGKSKGLFRKKK